MGKKVVHLRSGAEDADYFLIEAPFEGASALWSSVMTAVEDVDRRITFDIDVRQNGSRVCYRVTPGEIDYRDPLRNGVHVLEDAIAVQCDDDGHPVGHAVTAKIIIGCAVVEYGMPVGMFKMASPRDVHHIQRRSA